MTREACSAFLARESLIVAEICAQRKASHLAVQVRSAPDGRGAARAEAGRGGAPRRRARLSHPAAGRPAGAPRGPGTAARGARGGCLAQGLCRYFGRAGRPAPPCCRAPGMAQPRRARARPGAMRPGVRRVRTGQRSEAAPPAPPPCAAAPAPPARPRAPGPALAPPDREGGSECTVGTRVGATVGRGGGGGAALAPPAPPRPALRHAPPRRPSRAAARGGTGSPPRGVSSLLPIASCLLPLAYCLLPVAYSLLPLAYSLLPVA